MSESSLKQLVSEGKATIFYIHGTARSGSTIAEIIFSKLADRAINQPFGGLRHKLGEPIRPKKQPFDTDIYEAACGLIVEEILEILQQKSHVTILVKDLSGYFHPQIWERWIQIPEKFLFTIREPHLQYLSWLSGIVDLVSKTNGWFTSNLSLALEKVQAIETLELQSLRPAWSGTTISYNLQEWQNLIQHRNLVRSAIAGSSKKLAVLDSIELRQNPKYAIGKTTEQLGFDIDNVEGLCRDLLVQSKEKILDITDLNYFPFRKARNSKEIEPLVLGEAIGPYAFPRQSREHIWRLIPLYLDLLYAPENAAMPSRQQLEETVAGSETWKLAALHPFVAYAIALFHFHGRFCSSETKNDQDKNPAPEISSLIDRIVNGKTKTLQGEEKPNSELFGDSFAVVDAYSQQAN